jgi:hypothetical protein
VRSGTLPSDLANVVCIPNRKEKRRIGQLRTSRAIEEKTKDRAVQNEPGDGWKVKLTELVYHRKLKTEHL